MLMCNDCMITILLCSDNTVSAVDVTACYMAKVYVKYDCGFWIRVGSMNLVNTVYSYNKI